MSIETKNGKFIFSDNLLFALGWMAILFMVIAVCITFAFSFHQKQKTSEICISQGMNWDGNCYTNEIYREIGSSK